MTHPVTCKTCREEKGRSGAAAEYDSVCDAAGHEPDEAWIDPEEHERRQEIKKAIDGTLTCSKDGCRRAVYKDERDYCPQHSDV